MESQWKAREKLLDRVLINTAGFYGDLQGILTLEDIFETLLGLEIVDEGDETVDMQELARDRWKRRAEEIGFESEE